MIADMHCDTIALLLDLKKKGQTDKQEYGLLNSPGHLDLQKMQKSGYVLQNFALFVEMSECEDPWEEVQALYAVYEEEMDKDAALIGRVLCYEDIGKLQKEGKMCALLTVEEGGVCKGDLAKLEQLYKQGVRMMTLTWNFENELGYPHCHEVEKRIADAGRDVRTDALMSTGLKEKGFEFVERMQQLGMIVDVSHLSDEGFWDVCKAARKPFVASHSNAREICRSSRNLTDDMIRALAKKGGVTGLNYCMPFVTESLWREKDVRKEMLPLRGTDDYLQMLVNHAKHIVNVGGIECLGLGSDFDGIKTHESLAHAGEMDKLCDAMKKAGFTESRLDKILYENVLRVYRDVL